MVTLSVKMASRAQPRDSDLLLLLLRFVLRKGARTERLNEHHTSSRGQTIWDTLGLEVPSDRFRLFSSYS